MCIKGFSYGIILTMQVPDNILIRSKKDCKGIAIILWVYLLFSFVSSIVFYVVAVWVSISDRVYNVSSCLLTIVAMSCAIFVAYKKYGFRIEKKYFKKNFSLSIIPLMVLVIFGLNFINNLIMSMITLLFSISTAQPSMDFGTDMISNMALFCSAVLIAPIWEELLFRGAILRILDRYNHTIAIVCSSILFAMMHGSLAQWVYTFALGLILAYLSLKYDSLLLPMCIHATNNMFSVLLYMYNNTFVMIGMVMLMLCGVATLVYLIWQNKRIFQLKKDWNYPYMRYIFLNPYMIGILIVCTFSLLMEMFKNFF